MISLAAAVIVATQSCAIPPGAHWSYGQSQYPGLGERLTIGAGGARIGGRPLRLIRRGKAITLADDRAGARFYAARSARAVEGFWFSPKTAWDHARAFRVVLPPSAAGWSGVLMPKEEKLRLNAWLLDAPGGKTDFLVRNPDGLVGDMRFTATRSSCRYALRDVNDLAHHAALDLAGNTATITGLSETMPRVRLSPAGAAAVPRDVPTAAPESVGLDRRLLAQLFANVAAFDPTVRGAPIIHSILVARRGKLVAEQYFGGYSADDLHELRSLSKSFVPLLVGAARVHGVKLGTTTTIGSLLPQYGDLFRADPRKAAITLGDLLAMRSGLACDDFDDSSPAGEDRMQAQAEQPDWYRFVLSVPLTSAPGSHYAYCSAGTHVAAGLVAAAAHREALDLFQTWLAGPLDIDSYSLPLDPTRRAYFGGGAHMRPRDVLKFGQLVLDHGRWNGRQIVDRDFLDQALACRVAEPDCSEGLGWHFHTLEAGGRKYREIEANGNGGQLLMIFPELDLAVVFTAANFNSYPVWRKFREEIVPQYILSAIRR